MTQWCRVAVVCTIDEQACNALIDKVFLDQVYALVTFDPVDVESADDVELVVDGDDDEHDQIQKLWMSGRETRPCGVPTAAERAVMVEYD